MNTKFRCAVMATVALTLSLLAGDKQFKMSGTVASEKNAGKTVYVLLLKEGAAKFNVKPLYATSVVLNAKGEGKYVLTGIAEGSYAAVMYVDVDGSKTLSKGDLFGYNTSADAGSGDLPFALGDLEFEMGSGDWYTFEGTYLLKNAGL
ncbi:MAG: hypothetical protein WC708_02350 [Lentisphaeria bacterium]